MSISFPAGAVTRAALSAIVLLSIAQPAVAEICVDVDLRFTGPTPPAALVRSLQRETTAIWGAYDVRILWAATADACTLVLGQFDAVVDDRRSPSAPAQVTLGRTRATPRPPRGSASCSCSASSKSQPVARSRMLEGRCRHGNGRPTTARRARHGSREVVDADRIGVHRENSGPGPPRSMNSEMHRVTD